MIWLLYYTSFLGKSQEKNGNKNDDKALLRYYGVIKRLKLINKTMFPLKKWGAGAKPLQRKTLSS